MHMILQILTDLSPFVVLCCTVFLKLEPASLPVVRLAGFAGVLFFALRQDFFITTGGCRGLKSSGMLSL